MSQQLSSLIYPMVDSAMTTIWNHIPNKLQREVIARLFLMKHQPHIPSALLLVQITGGGKSMVPTTVGIPAYGVTLIIENTKFLSANQVTKYDIKNAAHGLAKAI